MPTTLVHGFVPALCAAQVFPCLSFREKIRLAVWCFVLGNGADLDMIPAALIPEHFSLIHREWGHNLFTLTLFTIAGVAILRRYVLPGRFSRSLAYAFCIPAVFSHPMLDAFGTAPDHTGVPLLWPFSEQVWAIPFELLPAFDKAETGHPLWRIVGAPDYWGRAVFFELTFILLSVGLWTITLRLWSRWKASRTPSAEPKTA